MKPARVRLLLLFVLTLVIAMPATAGNNAAGTVHLSWSREADVTLSTALPVAPPFPLYVVIDNARDIQALGVSLRWFPYDRSLLTGYDVLPAEVDRTCGWSMGARPTEPFQGDRTYEGTIDFPLGSDKSCIAYYFQAPACDRLPPAVFQVAQLIVKDSNGAYDTLRVTGSAKFTGGSDCPVDRQSAKTKSDSPAFAIWASPNPSRGSAQLVVTLPSAGQVEVSIYDVRGRLVMPLLKSTLPAGTHSSAWQLNDREGRRVPQGLYFARLRGPAGSKTATLLIVQ